MRLYIREMLDAQGAHLSFHTPGHKRAGEDITELCYSDSLLSPRGVIAAAEKDIAEILGAARSFILTDGSTCGIFSMLYALKAQGVRSLAFPESSHRSVSNACRALSLTPVPILQTVRRGISVQPSAAAIEAAVKSADALLLTSPDYYGFLAPMSEARQICATHAKPFIIDGAHGAHLHFTDMYAGKYADMWVDGVHKSLPALTQGAVVSAKTERWAAALREGVRTFRTTSPSYPIMASVEEAVKFPRNPAIEAAAEELKGRLGALENDDWTKIAIFFGAYADGAESALEAAGVYPEFNDKNYLMFYLSPCTEKEDLLRLEGLLQGLPRSSAEEAERGVIPIYSEE